MKRFLGERKEKNAFYFLGCHYQKYYSAQETRFHIGECIKYFWSVSWGLLFGLLLQCCWLLHPSQIWYKVQALLYYSASLLRLAEPSSPGKVLCCFWGTTPPSEAKVTVCAAPCSSACCGVRQLLTLHFQRLEFFSCLSWSCSRFFS